MRITKTEIKSFLEKYNVSIVGFGRLPQNIELLELKGNLKNTIVFGLALSKSVLATITTQPTLIYKAHYKTVNWLLDQTAFYLVQYIEKRGKRAIAVPASQTVDWERQKGHISHKALACAAGLGFIGRSGLLIHPVYGARVRYASILTDLEFEPDPAITLSCGNCHKCVDACPAGAISEQGVDLKVCLAKLKEFSRIRGIGQYICGICVKVCNGRD